jgi:hypothetical protein
MDCHYEWRKAAQVPQNRGLLIKSALILFDDEKPSGPRVRETALTLGPSLSHTSSRVRARRTKVVGRQGFRNGLHVPALRIAFLHSEQSPLVIPYAPP